MDKVFFAPREGWVGDIIPFCEDDQIRLFFLHELRENPRVGMGWGLVTTGDLVHFKDHGVALPHGGMFDPDFNAYTGSVVKDDDGLYHLFYTGHNPRFIGDDGLPLQVVMHATSDGDMLRWDKRPEPVCVATPGHGQSDWRDPFVFRDESRGCWRMLLAARSVEGAERRRGVTAQCVSKDLETWEAAPDFWAPNRYIAHECPEAFRWGDWWYLVYSEFSDAFCTRYCMSRSLDGPWVSPERDSVDGRGFYAAKTAEWHGRRFFFGWIPTHVGHVDDGDWQWAGTMSVCEAIQCPDGTLDFRLPEEFVASFDTVVEDGVTDVRIGRPDGSDVMMVGEAPRTCLMRLDFTVGEDKADLSLLLHASDDGDRAHMLRLEPRHGRMVVDRWPRRVTGGEQWQISGDIPHQIETERFCDLRPGVHTLIVVIEDDICVANLDGSVMLSTRMETSWGDHIGLCSTSGETVVNELRLATRSEGGSRNVLEAERR